MATTTDARSRTGTLIKVVLWGILLSGVGLATLTFFWFVSPATESVEAVEPADAVVVFVGGGDRFETAAELIDSGAAGAIVVPNGRNGEVPTRLCDRSDIEVFCPDSETIDTRGEARAIGELAEQEGWTRLVAVTSPYHVHRATYQLSQCFSGEISAVSAPSGLDRDVLVEKVAHEWLGTLAAMTFQRAC